MGKRLVVGLLKGLVIGAAIGAGFHFGLGWAQVGFTLALLIAMGTGATAAVLAGKPPWQREAWLEAGLKGGTGLALSAFLYWLAARYGALGVPFSLPPLFVAGAPWTELPILVAPAVGGLFGALVELDNTEGGESGKKAQKDKDSTRARARVADPDVDVGVEAAPGRNRRARGA